MIRSTIGSTIGRLLCGVAAVWCFAAPAAKADILVVANDNHSVNINGVMTAAKNAAPDGVAIVDVSHFPAKLIGTVDAPTSVVGAPTSVWISPDESWVIVTAASKIDPQNSDKIIDDDQVSVIDLKSSPPKIVQQVAAGKGANEVSVSPDGTLALVANRAEGTVSVFTIKDKRLDAAGKVDLGNPKSMPSSVKFLHDGKTALVTRYGDNAVGVLRIDGSDVKLDQRKIVTGVNPYTLDISADGKLATVGNMGGGGDGDICTVSLIDLTDPMMRTIDSVAVPSSPEGIKFSPDGRYVGVASVDGSTKPSSSPLFHEHGRLWLLAVHGKHLQPVAEAPIGRWSQGIAFSRDGRTLFSESMIDHGLNVFHVQGNRLIPAGTLDLKGAPAALRTSWP
ncbi:MAG TPA: YncE family protein [Stellaceae bacterium]|jgi:DNA-binding beta-propeller fold protein YncE|nr:YncE family protein [Stellaceae bacterium]